MLRIQEDLYDDFYLRVASTFYVGEFTPRDAFFHYHFGVYVLGFDKVYASKFDSYIIFARHIKERSLGHIIARRGKRFCFHRGYTPFFYDEVVQFTLLFSLLLAIFRKEHAGVKASF